LGVQGMGKRNLRVMHKSFCPTAIWRIPSARIREAMKPLVVRGEMVFGRMPVMIIFWPGNHAKDEQTHFK
jgi:hypothetical protein